jgi:hypothetical protein
LDLYELSAQDTDANHARTMLAALLAQFTQGFDRPELIRANAIIQAPT